MKFYIKLNEKIFLKANLHGHFLFVDKNIIKNIILFWILIYFLTFFIFNRERASEIPPTIIEEYNEEVRNKG